MKTKETLEEKLGHYTIENTLTFDNIADGYPIISVSNDYADARIALHGAHVLDYTPTGHKPVIFTSKKAIYEEGTAIRGGIPICWPWFSAHPTDASLPSHGFARKAFWELFRTYDSPDGTTLVFNYSKWDLHAELTIKIGESLTLELKTTNTGKETASVGGAIHSYFCISDVANISLAGLENTSYIDTLTETLEIQDEEVLIEEETDRIYLDTVSTVSLYDKEWNRNLIVEKTGSSSTVIWNPWINGAAKLADLEDNDYLEFICIEAANARKDVYKLAPGSSHTLGTTITAV